MKFKKILTFLLVILFVIGALYVLGVFDGPQEYQENTAAAETDSQSLLQLIQPDEPSQKPAQNAEENTQIEYRFRNSKLLNEHFEKHGKEMGFSSAAEYQAAASAVANNPDALHKLEAEDGDDVFYLERTNEFVIISTDGFIRTYFCPDSGIAYFNRQ